jgi:hypothetical protein
MGGRRIFLKTYRASLFNEDLSNEPNFGRIHLAGQGNHVRKCAFSGLWKPLFFFEKHILGFLLLYSFTELFAKDYHSPLHCCCFLRIYKREESIDVQFCDELPRVSPKKE